MSFWRKEVGEKKGGSPYLLSVSFEKSPTRKGDILMHESLVR